jgi:hypothetical protein
MNDARETPDVDRYMTVSRDLVGAMMKRLQDLEEGIGRIYMAHKKAGCAGCDLCKSIERVLLVGALSGAGRGGGPPASLLPFIEHASTCGYPDAHCTCPIQQAMKDLKITPPAEGSESQAP